MKGQRENFSPVFDYIFREVSAETGENIKESFEEFSQKLYQSESVKKKRIRVFLLNMNF